MFSFFLYFSPVLCSSLPNSQEKILVLYQIDVSLCCVCRLCGSLRWSSCNKHRALLLSVLNVKYFVVRGGGGAFQSSLNQASENLKACRLLVLFSPPSLVRLLFCPFGYNVSHWDKPWGAGRGGIEQGAHCSGFG